MASIAPDLAPYLGGRVGAECRLVLPGIQTRAQQTACSKYWYTGFTFTQYSYPTMSKNRVRNQVLCRGHACVSRARSRRISVSLVINRLVRGSLSSLAVPTGPVFFKARQVRYSCACFAFRRPARSNLAMLGTLRHTNIFLGCLCAHGCPTCIIDQPNTDGRCPSVAATTPATNRGTTPSTARRTSVDAIRCDNLAMHNIRPSTSRPRARHIGSNGVHSSPFGDEAICPAAYC